MTSGAGKTIISRGSFRKANCYLKKGKHKYRHGKTYDIQCVPQLLECWEFFHVHKSYKIECCSYKTPKIIQNMILSEGLEIKLSL